VKEVATQELPDEFLSIELDANCVRLVLHDINGNLVFETSIDID